MDKGQATLEGDSYRVLCSAWLHPHRMSTSWPHNLSSRGWFRHMWDPCVTAITMLIGTNFGNKVPGQPGFSHQGSHSVMAQKLSSLPPEQPQWLWTHSGPMPVMCRMLIQKEEGCDTEKGWWHVLHPESLPEAEPSSGGLGSLLMLRTPSLWQIFYPQSFVGLFLWHVTKGVSSCLPTQPNKCQLLFFKTKYVGSPWLFLQDLKPGAIISSGALLVSQSLCQVVLQLEWRRKGVCPLGDTHRECLSEPGLASVPLWWVVKPLGNFLLGFLKGSLLSIKTLKKTCHVSPFAASPASVAHTLFSCVS